MEIIEITKAPENAGSHSCRCGEESSTSFPELDATLIPHKIRHPAIFGALESLKSGQGMVLVAPHKPIPSLAQIEKKHPGNFSVNFLDEGPDKWHIELIRN
jgi:uncharacterized protein (DUF2249 family)